MVTSRRGVDSADATDTVMIEDADVITGTGTEEMVAVSSVRVAGSPGGEEEEEGSVSLDAPLVFRALYLSVGVVGMCGNLMVLLVILSSRRLRRSTTNKFICNQSLLDFSASFFIAFTAFFRRPGGIPPGLLQELFCRLWLTNWPLWGVFVSSTYNLVALTFERYFAIVYPLRHSRSFTNTKAYVIMAAVWLVGPAYLGAYGVTSSTVKEGTCTVYSEWPNQLTQRAVGILTVVIQYFTPLFSITFAYVRIFLTLRKSSQETSNGSVNDRREERMSKAKRNVVKTLAQVFACFVFCWSWNQIFYALFNFGYLLDFDSDFYNFTVLCVFLNSCMNPIVYSLNYQQFKVTQRALFCSCLTQEPAALTYNDSRSDSEGVGPTRSKVQKSPDKAGCWEDGGKRNLQKAPSVSTIMTYRSDDPRVTMTTRPGDAGGLWLQPGGSQQVSGEGGQGMSEEEEERKGISTRL